MKFVKSMALLLCLCVSVAHAQPQSLHDAEREASEAQSAAYVALSDAIAADESATDAYQAAILAQPGGSQAAAGNASVASGDVSFQNGIDSYWAACKSPAPEGPYWTGNILMEDAWDMYNLGIWDQAEILFLLAKIDLDAATTHLGQATGFYAIAEAHYDTALFWYGVP